MVFLDVIWFCLVFVSDCCIKESLSVIYGNPYCEFSAMPLSLELE